MQYLAGIRIKAPGVAVLTASKTEINTRAHGLLWCVLCLEVVHGTMPGMARRFGCKAWACFQTAAGCCGALPIAHTMVVCQGNSLPGLLDQDGDGQLGLG